jgi:nucleoside-diphosphate-sugar epimerase
MRILVIGTGTIGRAVVAALSAGNEIISASLRSTNLKVDIADPASIQQMYRSLGKLDAVVCAAGRNGLVRSLDWSSPRRRLAPWFCYEYRSPGT